MNVLSMTKKDLLALEPFLPEEQFNGVVIVNTGRKHESGYMCMRFVLVNGTKIVGCVGNYSDVVELNGIGGYGLNWRETMKTDKVDRVAWSIDMLPNGCCRLFSRNSGYLSFPELMLSSFEIFFNREEPNNE